KSERAVPGRSIEPASCAIGLEEKVASIGELRGIPDYDTAGQGIPNGVQNSGQGLHLGRKEVVCRSPGCRCTLLSVLTWCLRKKLQSRDELCRYWGGIAHDYQTSRCAGCLRIRVDVDADHSGRRLETSI